MPFSWKRLQIDNMKMASRNQRNFCRWNRPRAQCCPMIPTSTPVIGHLHCQGEARVSCDGHFSLGKISLEKGLSSRKSTVKFFRWAAFTTLSKAIVERRLLLGPKRPTNYLSRAWVHVTKMMTAEKIWAKPLNYGQILSSGYLGRLMNLEKPQLRTPRLGKSSPEKYKQPTKFSIYHQSRTVLVYWHSFFISFMSYF